MEVRKLSDAATFGRFGDLAGDSSRKRFGPALRDLLLSREEFQTGTGNINWAAFADSLKDVHYETLRKSVSGERPPSASLVQTIAAALGVRPDYFVEYRLTQAQRAFDPREVGFERALANLEEWASAQSE